MMYVPGPSATTAWASPDTFGADDAGEADGDEEEIVAGVDSADAVESLTLAEAEAVAEDDGFVVDGELSDVPTLIVGSPHPAASAGTSRAGKRARWSRMIPPELWFNR